MCSEETAGQKIPEGELDQFQTLVAIVERLRAPGGCPWDREQTHASLKRNLLEECYEVLEAIDGQDGRGLSEELGDLLVQVAFHADIAREAGAYSLIDGYQGAGQVPLALSQSGVDFYTAGPLKWLCGGPGLSYLYVREQLIQSLRPRITSWFATERQFDFDLEGFEYRPDARRFELGTPALPTVHTALGGQELVDEIGIDAIVARNRVLTERLIDGARSAGFSMALAEPEQRTSIVMIRHDDPSGAVRHLAEHDVIVDYRPGFVRVSPHFYNTEEEVDRCLHVLAAFSS